MKRLLDFLISKAPGHSASILSYKIEPLTPAPSFWALIPVRVEQESRQPQQDQIASHLINKKY